MPKQKPELLNLQYTKMQPRKSAIYFRNPNPEANIMLSRRIITSAVMTRSSSSTICMMIQMDMYLKT